MARISKEAIAKREAFLTDLFKQSPEMTVGVANDQLKGKFGSKMNPMKVSALRKQVTGKAPARGRKPGAKAAAPTTTAAPTTAARVVKRANGSGTELLIHCAPEARGALEQAIGALRSLGANIEIRGRLVEE